jgi:hypothetical protein
MFHLMAEVNFPMGKAHVTDLIVTTNTGCRVLATRYEENSE